MASKRYKLLRRTMFEDDVDQATLAKAIGRSCGYMTDRFTGKYPFKTALWRPGGEMPQQS